MSVEKDESLLRGEDFLVEGEYRAYTLEIRAAESVSRKGQDGAEREGILIYFQKAKKPFFAPDDKLNQRLIRCELGTLVPEQMVGKSLTLIPVMGNWFGVQNGLAIRVAVTGDKPKPQVSKSSFGTVVTGVKVS